MDDLVRSSPQVTEAKSSSPLPASSKLQSNGRLPRRGGLLSRRGPRVLAALVVLVLLAGGGAWWLMGSGGATRYTTAAVTRRTLTKSVTATGSVNPVLTVIVGSYVSGIVQDVFCDFNSQVKEGQVCAKIDPRPFQSVVAEEKANLDSANAQLTKDTADLDYAKLSYDRATQLQDKSDSQDVVDAAKNVYDKAQAQIGIDQAAIEQHQAELDAANVNLGYTDIVSPVDGVVVSSNVTKGQTVAASLQTPTLFLIAADLSKMQVEANVSESDIGVVKEGEPVDFTVDAFPDRTFTGAVTQVRQSPQTVQNVVTYDVVIAVDNQDLALKPGMTAATEIILDQSPNALNVPDQALRYVPAGVARVTARAPAAPAVSGATATGAAGGTQAARVGRPTGGTGDAGGAGGRFARGGGAPGGAGQGGGGGARNGATRPPPAVATNQGQVWVLRDGEPVAVPVITGLDDGASTEIVSGDLQPGDQVITGEDTGGSGGVRAGRTGFPIPRL